MKGIAQIKADNAAASKKNRPRPKRSRKGTATPAKEAMAQSKGAGETAADEGAPVPADPAPYAARVHINRGDSPYYDAYDGPPPSLIPPEVQAEIDRLIRENRSLRAAMRALLGEE